MDELSCTDGMDVIKCRRSQSEDEISGRHGNVQLEELIIELRFVIVFDHFSWIKLRSFLASHQSARIFCCCCYQPCCIMGKPERRRGPKQIHTPLVVIVQDTQPNPASNIKIMLNIEAQ